MELTMTTNKISDFRMEAGQLICEACNVQVHQKGYDQHVNGKKHRAKQEQYDKKHKTIFVSGISKFSPKDLEKIFNKYGDIVKVQKQSNKPFAFIQFVNKDSVEKALRARVFAGGMRLFVNRYKDNNNPECKKEKSRTFSETLSNTSQSEEAQTAEGPKMGVRELPVQLTDPEWCPEGEDVFLWLVQDFISQVELSAEMYQSLNVVLSDVENLFKPHFPECRITIFGSCGSMLAFKNSDVDLFFYTADREQSKDFVKKHAKEMYRSRQFRVIARIPNARVPIIKFEHLTTGWQGDLTADSHLGVCNSHLIKFLVSLDPRIRPLIMVIKYWAKVCGITGFQNGLTTYSLVMLVIFYLQQLNPPVLPTIAQLQQLSEDKQYSVGWQCNFYDENWKVQLECLPQPNNLTLREMLNGFFLFYHNFDFNTVICPLLGRSIPVKDFESDDGSDLPKEMLLYKEILKDDPKCKFKTNNVFLKVQDPFELCLNITRNVVERSFLVFKEACKVSLGLCEKEDDCTLLKGLFSIDQEAFDTNRANLKMFIPFKEEMSVTPDASESALVEWYELSTDAIMLVLKEILKFTVDPSGVEVSSKIKKLESSQDVHTPVNNHSIFICSGKADVWNSRRKMSKLLNSMKVYLNPFETEVCISNSLYSPNDKHFFSFTIAMSTLEDFKKERKGIEVNFNFKKWNNSMVKGFINFLKSDFKILVLKADAFINKIKSSLATTGVKESHKELLDLNVSKIPNIKELKNRESELLSRKENHDKTAENQSLPTTSLASDNHRNESRIDDNCGTTSCLNKTDEARSPIEMDDKPDTVIGKPTSQKTEVTTCSLSSTANPSKETQKLINEFFKPNSPDQVSVLENSIKCSENSGNHQFNELLRIMKKIETQSTFTSDEVNPFLASIEKVALKTLDVESKSSKQDEAEIKHIECEVENEETGEKIKGMNEVSENQQITNIECEQNKSQRKSKSKLYKDKLFNMKNDTCNEKNDDSQDKPEDKGNIINEQQNNDKMSLKLCNEKELENIETDQKKEIINSEESKSQEESDIEMCKEESNLKEETFEDKDNETWNAAPFSSEGKCDERIVEKGECLGRDKMIKQQKSNFKMPLQRLRIDSERSPKQRKHNRRNRNAPGPQTHLWVGGGPPRCQQWSRQPPAHDDESQQPYSSRAIQRQQQWYPTLFKDNA